MARLVALGVAVVVVAFGAAFGISRAVTGGGSTAHAAKPPAMANRTAPTPVRDTALAASFSGQLVSLKLPAAPKRHPHKAARHHAAAKAAAASSSGSSASASSSSAPSTSAPSSSGSPAAPVEISPAMPSIGSPGGGSSGATHHASHHHRGTGSGTITIP